MRRHRFVGARIARHLRRGLAAILVVTAAATPAATGIADEVKARLADPPVLRGQFEQRKRVAGFSRSLVSEGDFVLARKRGILWNTRRPFESRLTLTRERLTARHGAAGEEYRMDAGGESGVRAVNEVLLAALAGDLAVLQRSFRLEGELVGREGWTLTLVPANAGVARLVERVELEGDRYVRRVKVAEANGDATEISFSKLAESSATSDEEAALLAQ